ncbi:MAG: Gfo/Idh/MocA family oxidoreductase [Gammaproteobacteria bacterium]|nr:Gfo/Idh/MocA family oxidoreductase [Gammaproteobacteria bacterium]
MSLRIGLLGTGRIAETALAPAITAAQNAELWSVLSRSKERAAQFASAHNAAAPNAAYDSIDSMLDDPNLDAVLIATPDKLHVEQAIAAARAGKHVLAEKPMATNKDDAQRMVDACEAAGVKLGVAYHLRWHQGHQRIAQMAHDGDFGELRHMRAQWSFLAPDDTNWRASADVGKWWGLAGVGTHCLDLIRWMMTPTCGEITDVRSVITRPVFKGPHDENAVLAMEFENGATAELNTSVLFQAPTRAEIYGSKGFATCTGTLGPHGAGKIETHEGPLDFEIQDPYVGEIEDFAAAVSKGVAPAVDGVEGARNVALLVDATS